MSTETAEHINELTHKITVLTQENLHLKMKNDNLLKLIYGAKRERYISSEEINQPTLFDELYEAAEEEATEDKVEEKEITYKRKIGKKKVGKNTFPKHLVRKVSTLLPEGVDTDPMTQLGEDVTELLSYHPGSLTVKQIRRPRYIDKRKKEATIHQAPMPPRLVRKGMVDESLIAHLMTEKILYHTPVHRFNKKLKQEGLSFIKDSQLNEWFHKGAEALLPVGHLLKAEILRQPYIQLDESHIKVLSKNKPNSSHRGYMWVMHCPLIKSCYFRYDPSRSTQAAQQLLDVDYKGIVQTDGYQPYEALKLQKGYFLYYCMAHGRRKFFDAKEAGHKQATHFLIEVQKLYAIESKAKKEKMTVAQRQQLRKDEAIPILLALKEWLAERSNDPRILPNSPLGKAVHYNYKRWDGLMAYAHDGRIEIDNNLIENLIRPLALGRKNYLFAGSHDAAEHLALLYSLVGTAKAHGLNVYQYLHWLLQQVVTHKVDDNAINWLPHKLSNELIEKFIVKE